MLSESQYNPADIPVYIIDDDDKVNNALSYMIGSVGYDVKQFSNPADFLQLDIEQQSRGCVLIDLRMPIMSGLEVQEALIKAKCQLPIIFISGHVDVPMAVKLMKQGAADVLIKPINNNLLLDAINAAVRRNIQQNNIREKKQDFTSQVKLLTAREKEVLDLVVQGKFTKDIADILHISRNTVDVHRSKIMKKLKVRSLSELIHLVLTHQDL